MIATAHPAETLPQTLTTVDEFDAWQRQHVKEGSFEFVRGRVINKHGLKLATVQLVSFLVRSFIGTDAFKRNDSLLLRLESFGDETRKRVPDLTYLTAEQKAAIRRGERVNTRFAIEILSDSESYQDVLGKVTERGPQDYFDGGAQLVW